ncbi:response regulator [Ardenticatena maritima]|uniref:response regulator n=1 Tax=Ardenticatena maritima TaxID=872965 RepID=UPI0013649F88|nr:response regulator transcription factor [Ardenticatena maritima]
MTQRVRVLLADDHPLIRTGIRTALCAEPEIELVAEASNGDEAYALALQHRPDVLLLDLNMPGLSPLEIVARLRDEVPSLNVVVLTAFDDDVYVRSLLNAGVKGYILKDEALEAVVQAIHSVVVGGTWFSETIARRLFSQSDCDAFASPAVLSEREKEILRYLLRGMSNQEIAKELGLAEQTVRNYISRIYNKLGVRSRTEAALWAWMHQFNVL